MRTVTLASLAALLVAGILAPAASAQPRPLLLPQVKVDRVDAADPSGWYVVVSGLDENGSPANVLESGVQVFLVEGKGPVGKSESSVVARFGPDGLAAKGFRGTLKEVPKAGVPQAVALAVGLHAEVPRDVSGALPATVAEVLGKLPADTRVALLVYNDTVFTSWQPSGGSPQLGDVNNFQGCLASLRASAGISRDEPPGVACGRLFQDPKAPGDLANLFSAPQGMFPRLLGLDEDGPLMDWARRRGHYRIDRAEIPTDGVSEGEAGYVVERFAAGVVEAGLRVLAAGTPEGTLRRLVLFSDGRDGYLRYADAVADRVTGPCRAEASQCKGAAARVALDTLDSEGDGASRTCARAVLECTVPRVSRALVEREKTARERLVALVQLARASRVRIDTVAIPGTDEVGAARLQALATRTGGTFRSTAGVADLKAVGLAVATDMNRAVVIRPETSLEAGQAYTLAVAAGEPRSGPYRFVAGTDVPPGAGRWSKGRTFAIRKLGHGWGPPVLWMVAVLAVLMAISLAWALGKGVAALAKKIAAPPRPKRPAAPKMPTLKRPGS